MIKLGTITGTQGVDGKLFIKSEYDENIELKNIKSVDIGFSNKFVNKYQVAKIEQYQKGYLLQLKEIHSKEQAISLKEQAVFITELQTKNKKKIISKIGIIGYTVYNDETSEEIGRIIDIYEIPAHDVLLVNSGGKEVFIPFIDEFITSIDTNECKVSIKVIPGLLEINEKEIVSKHYE